MFNRPSTDWSRNSWLKRCVVEPFLRPARSKDMSAQSPSIRRVLPIAKPHRHEEETICIRKRRHCTSKPSSHQSCVNSPKLCWAMYFASHALQVLAKARRNVRNSSSLDNSNLFACVSNDVWRQYDEKKLRGRARRLSSSQYLAERIIKHQW